MYKYFKASQYIVIALFFVVIFFTFLNVQLWDYDFWWHIATGRYIVETGTIPDKDPFSFTSNLDENKNQFPERENFILKQYWLSQIIFYLIYEHTGATGIILLRAILLTGTLLLVFYHLRRWDVSLPVSFILVFAVFSLLAKSSGDRPVLFTILFTAVTFFILEAFKDKKDKKIFFLPVLMLLWSNLHGGFILGVVIIVVFMFAEGVKAILGKAEYKRDKIILFYAAASMSVCISFINPTGWDAFAIAFSSKYQPFTQNIQEYMSPLFLYKEKVAPINYWYLFLAMLYIAVLIIRIRKIELSHMILLSGLLIMSLTAIRFIVYYGIIASMVLGQHLDSEIKDLLKKRFSEEFYRKIITALTYVALLSMVFYMLGVYRSEALSLDIAGKEQVPKSAIDFIEKNRLSGNMFNEYAYGGYIIWRLYPQQKPFIDSRALNIAVMMEYGWIINTADIDTDDKNGKAYKPKSKLWEMLLNHYNINYIFLSVVGLFAQAPSLILELNESSDWVPVYSDIMSVIFIKNTEQNKPIIQQYKLTKEDVYNIIIYRTANNAFFNSINPRSLISLGDAFYKMGRLEDAIKAYKYALNRMPKNEILREKIMNLESEIERREGIN